MRKTTDTPPSSDMPKTRTFLNCCVPLFVLALGLVLSGCSVSETYMVPMRDKVKLATDVYLPRDGMGCLAGAPDQDTLRQGGKRVAVQVR